MSPSHLHFRKHANIQNHNMLKYGETLNGIMKALLWFFLHRLKKYFRFVIFIHILIKFNFSFHI